MMIWDLEKLLHFFLLLCSTSVFAQFKLDVESGVVFGTNYNKVRIPNSGGTQVNLAEDLSIDPKNFTGSEGLTPLATATISVHYTHHCL